MRRAGLAAMGFELFADQMPYTVILHMSGADWQTGTVPDYFADESTVVPIPVEKNVISTVVVGRLTCSNEWVP